MVPYATLLIPLYVLLKTLGLQNSLLGLALVLAVFQLPFAIFMMRISFEAVPRELEESAVVDGAGSFEVLRRIMLPAVRPGLITVGLFAFLAAWNDFIAPLILLSDDKKATLPLAIATLRQQTMGVIDYGATEAGVVVDGGALPDPVPPAPAPLRPGVHVGGDQGMRSAGLGRTSQYVLTGGIAVLFLFPLVWSAVASVSAQPGTAQARGIGLQQLRDAVQLRRRARDLPAEQHHHLEHHGRADARCVDPRRVRVRPVPFPGHDVLFLLTLAILMVPYGTLLIPMYVLLHAIGLQNSLLGVGLVLTLFQLPFAIFMMRISFEAVPRELEESALVDGAGSFAVLRRIFLPAVRPGVITVGLFAFLAAWNDFITPLILISSDKQSPLPLAIASLRQQTSFTIDYGATEAGVVVMAVPCLILFILLQRHYVRGFMSGAIKG